MLSSIWSASPGELRRLVFESTGRVVRGKKPLELFHKYGVKPRPSRYNGTKLNLVIFLKAFNLIAFNFMGFSKEEEHLRCVGSFAKAG